MKCSKKVKIAAAAGVVLLLLLAFCSWLFGWFSGSIDVIDFTAEEVEHLRLSVTLFGYEAVTISDTDDIRMVIENINSFRSTGSTIKNVLKYGIGAGGSVLHEFSFQLKNGERFCVVLSSNDGDQSRSDMQASYWVILPSGVKKPAKTCRGSLVFFFDLYEKDAQ